MQKVFYFCLVELGLLIHSVAVIAARQNNDIGFVGICALDSFQGLFQKLVAAGRKKKRIAASRNDLDGFKIPHVTAKLFAEAFNCIGCNFFGICFEDLPRNVLIEVFYTDTRCVGNQAFDVFKLILG